MGDKGAVAAGLCRGFELRGEVAVLTLLGGFC